MAAGVSVRAGAAGVPYGHVVGSEKWRGSRLVRGLQGPATVAVGSWALGRGVDLGL